MNIQVLASGSKGNSYLISSGETTLLLDAGIPFKKLQIALNHTISDLSGVLITHEHHDHGKAAKKLLEAGVDVYMSQGTACSLGLKSHRLHIVKPGQEYEVGDWIVQPFDTVHNAAEPLGFVLYNNHKALLYVTDTEYVKYQIKGLTHIMIECNYSPEIIKKNSGESISRAQFRSVVGSHMGIDTALEFLRVNDLSRLEQVYLIHLSDSNSDAEDFKRQVQEATGVEVYIA